MDPVSETKVYGENTDELLYYYSMMKGSDLRDSLANLMTLTNKARWVALDEANNVSQYRGRGKKIYGGKSKNLIEEKSSDESKELDDLSIEFVTSAINNFLSNYIEKPEKDSDYNLIMTLFVQLVISHGITLLPKLTIPEYVRPKVESCENYLNATADSILIKFMKELDELGNSSLIPYVESIGTAFFGVDTKSDAEVSWNKYMRSYLSEIKNPNQTYKTYLKYRGQLLSVTSKIRQQDVCPFFDLTPDQVNKIQKRLYDTFKAEYMNDLNSQYLKMLINGTD